MNEVILQKKGSLYKDTFVTDRQICLLVGVDTYQSLRCFDESLWNNLSNIPVLPENKAKISTIMSLYRCNIESIKKSLVVRCVDGPGLDSSMTSELTRSSSVYNPQLIDPLEEAEFFVFVFGLLILVTFVVTKACG